MRVHKFILALLIIIIFTSVNSKADEKKFARSYSAYTLPANGLELELWQTGRLNKGLGFYSRWQPRFEVEYGVTDRFTAGVYFNFSETKSADNNIPSSPLSLSSTSMEFRYRLSNPGEYFIDPALYMEVGYGGDEVFYEPKILLSKRFEKFEAVVNIISEIEKEIPDDELESKLEFTAGLAYELNPNISLGLEFRHSRNFEDIYEEEKNQASFAGPTFSLHTERLYMVVNFLAQFSGGPVKNNGLDLIGHEKYEVRAILGIGL